MTKLYLVQNHMKEDILPRGLIAMWTQRTLKLRFSKITIGLHFELQENELKGPPSGYFFTAGWRFWDKFRDTLLVYKGPALTG